MCPEMEESWISLLIIWDFAYYLMVISGVWGAWSIGRVWRGRSRAWRVSWGGSFFAFIHYFFLNLKKRLNSRSDKSSFIRFFYLWFCFWFCSWWRISFCGGVTWGWFWFFCLPYHVHRVERGNSFGWFAFRVQLAMSFVRYNMYLHHR